MSTFVNGEVGQSFSIKTGMDFMPERDARGHLIRAVSGQREGMPSTANKQDGKEFSFVFV